MKFSLENRPKKRSDCKDVPRPCPFVGCNHNTYLDINGSSVYIKHKKEPWDVDPKLSCVLDIIEDHQENSDNDDGMTLQQIGDILGFTNETARTTEASALNKLKNHLTMEYPDDLVTKALNLEIKEEDLDYYVFLSDFMEDLSLSEKTITNWKLEGLSVYYFGDNEIIKRSDLIKFFNTNTNYVIRLYNKKSLRPKLKEYGL